MLIYFVLSLRTASMSFQFHFIFFVFRFFHLDLLYTFLVMVNMILLQQLRLVEPSIIILPVDQFYFHRLQLLVFYLYIMKRVVY